VKYDWIIAGAGIFGATCAERLAAMGQTVLVIDRRPHLAGNCHTFERFGIMEHCYGPHVFHTNSDIIWRYVNRFAAFNSFVNRVKAVSGGRVFSMPINLATLYELWGVATPHEARQRIEAERVKIAKPDNLEEWALSQVGPELYHTLIYGYTKKQWGREPRELPASIIKRLPIRLTWDDNYYHARHQGIPVDGYTAMVAAMLDSPRIDVRLGEDLDVAGWRHTARRLIYTGQPDAYLGYRFGELPYRSLRFETYQAGVPDYQGNAIVNQCDLTKDYTRTIEHAHFSGVCPDNSTITREYPQEWHRGGEAFYPIADDAGRVLAAKYKAAIEADGDVIVGGRLGSYRYFDMDQAIGSALATVAEVFADDCGA
jgi:UDP-galactopyranose mutase